MGASKRWWEVVNLVHGLQEGNFSKKGALRGGADILSPV